MRVSARVWAARNLATMTSTYLFWVSVVHCRKCSFIMYSLLSSVHSSLLAMFYEVAAWMRHSLVWCLDLDGFHAYFFLDLTFTNGQITGFEKYLHIVPIHWIKDCWQQCLPMPVLFYTTACTAQNSSVRHTIFLHTNFTESRTYSYSKCSFRLKLASLPAHCTINWIT